MANVYLIFGSNLGDKSNYIESAKKKLTQHAGTIIQQSSVYETEPWGFEHENQFLNQVVLFETELDPGSLLKEIKRIETDLGRVREKERYSARFIDIDILFYDRLIFSGEELTIPHPELANRRFVLEPLAELINDFIHPVSGISVKALLERCPDSGIVKKVT
jgi:2-amino-4-hydroxy-6-hydroxymethyldihydropteridine diphosphokinase